MGILVSILIILIILYFVVDKYEKGKEEERELKLLSHQTIDERLRFYYLEGWNVQHETDTTCFMMRKKKFSYFWATFWFLFYGIGLIPYLIYYMAKKDETMNFRKDEFLRNRQTEQI